MRPFAPHKFCLLAPLLVLLASLALPLAAGAAEVSVRVELDRQTFYEGESFILTCVVEGPMRGIGTPRFPDLEDFVLVGTSSTSNFSWINGKASGSKTFQYQLIPQRGGTLEIPPIPVEVKGEIYQSRAITVQVRPQGAAAQGSPSGAMTPGQTSPPPQAREPEGGDGDRQVFIRSWVDEGKFYVGQQITHHFGLYRDLRIRFTGTPQYTPPDMTGFWAESLGDEISGYRKFDGRDFAATELRTALFPSESGTLSIGSASVRVRVRERSSWDFFSFDGRDRILRSQPIEVEILPLPDEGRPRDFQGTVASNVRLSAKLDPGPYEVGVPVTLNVELSGTGNPRAFAEPSFAPGDDFKAYDPDLNSETKVDEDRIRVRKSYTRVLVPRHEGELVIPAVSYSWFDPESGRYRSTKTKEFRLAVRASTSEETEPVVFSDLTPERVELLGRAIHHIKTDPLLAGDGRRFPRSFGFWIALLLPWPLLIGAWGWRRRKKSLLADQAGYRARSAKRAAAKRLKEAAEARQEGELDGFCAALSRGLQGYLADRFNSTAAGMTRDAVQRSLIDAGASDSLREETLGLLDACDRARFSPPSSGSEARMDELLDSAQTVIGRLESELGGKGRRRGVAALLALRLFALLAAGLLLRAAPAAAAPSADQVIILEEAAARYENGDYVAAATLWRNLTDAGVEDSHLWYNLGNAHFQSGQMGQAILAYKRALRLAPRDPEIRDNLELARGRRGGLDAAESGMVGRAWNWVRRSFSPGELAVAGLIVLWIGTLLLLLGITERMPWWRLRLPLILVALLLPLLSLSAWFAEWQDWSGQEAVLLVEVVNVQSGPGQDYVTLFQLNEGAELRMRERRGEWVRVSLGEDFEGWIPAATVSTL